MNVYFYLDLTSNILYTYRFDEDNAQNLMLMQVPLSALESHLWQCAQVVFEPKPNLSSSDSQQSSALQSAQ